MNLSSCLSHVVKYRYEKIGYEKRRVAKLVSINVRQHIAVSHLTRSLLIVSLWDYLAVTQFCLPLVFA